MATEAFVGDIFFERGDGASPEVFTRICQVFSISGVGESNDLVDATTFCSAGSREYVGGLADGEEISIEGNYEQGDVNLLAMIQDVKDKATGNYRIVVEDESPSEIFSFAALAMSWALNPSVDGRNTITYGLKISGPVSIV
jgi:hypothetical protein